MFRVLRGWSNRSDLSEHGVKIGGLRGPATAQRIAGSVATCRFGEWIAVGGQRGHAGVIRWRFGTSPSRRNVGHAGSSYQGSRSE